MKNVYIFLFLCSWLSCAQKAAKNPTPLEKRHLKLCLAETAIAVMSEGEKATLDSILIELSKREDGKFIRSIEGYKMHINPNLIVWRNYIDGNPKAKVNPDSIALFHERKTGGFLIITMSATVYQSDNFPNFFRPMESK